jgi:hypothetical protein
MADQHVIKALEDALQAAREDRHTDSGSVAVFLADRAKFVRFRAYSGWMDEMLSLRKAALVLVQDIDALFQETGTKIEEK